MMLEINTPLRFEDRTIGTAALWKMSANNCAARKPLGDRSRDEFFRAMMMALRVIRAMMPTMLKVSVIAGSAM